MFGCSRYKTRFKCVTVYVFQFQFKEQMLYLDDYRIDWRFHKMKREWDFIELLSHDTLRDASNGFLVDDRCIFGVEIFVINRPGEGESLSFVKEAANDIYTWKISNFSALINITTSLRDYC